jgi:hypothetical protein
MGLGFTKGVQVTVIREAGLFDQGPFIALRKCSQRGDFDAT